MPITDITKTAEEQVLGYLAIAQEVVVDGVHRVSEAVQPVLPDVPRPFAAEAAELLDGAFTFAEKLLKSGHQFTSRLIEASTTTPDIKPAAPKPAASTSAKASAK
ncbi:MAG: hypothetical protein JO148_02210 [Acidimicrobiia bacterium]|nr:hypothetical protein [Acidimicrobiia bacterium]